MNLDIKNPCHENWNNMTATEKGKFCAACQKEVVDFTNFSIPEIQSFFQKDKKDVCGRLQTSQLETLSVTTALPTASSIKKWTAIAVLTAVVSLSSCEEPPVMVGMIAPLEEEQLELPVDTTVLDSSQTITTEQLTKPN